MSNALPSAWVVHRLPGRLRLRILEKRGDPSYFTGVRESLTACADVFKVDFDAQTGGVLILHGPSMPLTAIQTYAQERSLFTITAPPTRPPRTLAEQAGIGLNVLNRTLTFASGGWVDLRSGLFLALVALAIVQASRGQFLAPAISLVWYALELAKKAHPPEP